MQTGFVFVLKMFQDKCNRDCNHDYFQCNRNRLHLCCNHPCQPVCHIVVVMPSVVGQQWLAFSGLIAEKFPKILP